jgi:protein phosphatase
MGVWERYSGVRVIGDVHGHSEALRALLQAAKRLDLFVVQLGDLVDHGPDSVETLRLALEIYGRQTGIFLRGNHDDRLRRALRGDPIKLGAVSHRTLDAVTRTCDCDTFIPRILAMLEASPWWLRINNYLLVHGAFHPAMLTAESPQEVFPQRAANKCRVLAL